MPRVRRLPRGFRRGLSEELACPHRELTCCATCAKKHPEIVDVYGQHFWVADESERVALRADMAATNLDAPLGEKENAS